MLRIPHPVFESVQSASVLDAQMATDYVFIPCLTFPDHSLALRKCARKRINHSQSCIRQGHCRP